jgi:hypothetical protein
VPNDPLKWLSSLATEILAEAKKISASKPGNPSVKFPANIRDEVVRLSEELPGRRLFLRQARLNDAPALFLISTGEADPGTGVPSDAQIEAQWPLSTEGWTPEQIAAWPDYQDEEARSFEYSPDQEDAN